MPMSVRILCRTSCGFYRVIAASKFLRKEKKMLERKRKEKKKSRKPMSEILVEIFTWDKEERFLSVNILQL